MSTSHLADNLALLHAETVRLVRTAASLSDDELRADSLCAGWSRAHILSHLARNADALGNLVHWATTGERRSMYASPEAREQDIEDGARRDAAEILTDLEDSAARFASVAPALEGAAEQVEVEARNGIMLRGGALPTMRLREVVFHHVDLRAGYTFEDSDPGFVKRSLDNAVERVAVERVAASGKAAGLTLRSDEGDVWTIGDGTTHATGSQAALLLWLARGVGDGVRSKGDLPDLPSWG